MTSFLAQLAKYIISSLQAAVAPIFRWNNEYGHNVECVGW